MAGSEEGQMQNISVKSESPEPCRAEVDGCPAPSDVVADAYVRHHAELVRFVALRTRDAELAADIAQEAFLRLIREDAAGRLPDQILAWLRQVALNLVVNRARHAKVADRWEPWLRPSTSPGDTPEGAAIGAERDRVVRGALASLPEAERRAMILAANGFAGREIAQAIGRSEGATRTLMCRARSRLRSELRSTGAF
jgi:RNA polymerase sigma-70 factor, ECF subfamily